MDKQLIDIGDRESEIVRQIPETAFEQALFLLLLDGQDLRDELPPIMGTETLKARIEPAGWNADGRLECYLVIELRSFSLRNPLPESYPFYVSICERIGPASEHYRVVIWWEMPANPYAPQAQANQWGFFPVLSVPTDTTR